MNRAGLESARRAALRVTFVAVALAALGTAPQAPAPEVDPRLAALTAGDRAGAERVLASLTASDAAFAAPLIELLRASEVGIAPGIQREALVGALERVSGERHGADWPAWVRWYSGTDLVPPTGFTGWKGALLGRIDPRFAALLAYGVPARVRTEEIVWGGVAFEGIPALDRPATISAATAADLSPSEPVFGVTVGDEARAYPLRILDWHEMVNDVVGGVPISLAYCTLCGSGIVYDGRAPDGAIYDFGSSGLLMRSNKLMVDRQTRSLWNQLTGRPVVGPLAEEAFRLRVLPSVVTTWEAWSRLHPETRVLSRNTGFDRPYEPGAAYGDYFASDGTMFPVAARSGELAPKARVFGIEREGLPKAFPLSALLAAGVVNDRAGDEPLVLVATGGRVDVQGRSVRSGAERAYDVGAAVRVYARGARRFRAGASERELVDASGAAWRIGEDALVGPDGVRLPRVPGTLSYWFAWSSYFPRTAVYSPGGSSR